MFMNENADGSNFIVNENINREEDEEDDFS